MAAELGIEVALWGREQTVGEGPFPALLDFDILINAISVRCSLSVLLRLTPSCRVRAT
jgi:hypothetical protein